MKKFNHWTPEESAVLDQIVKDFGGSPSRAFEKRPEWKTKLLAKHTEGAIFAKLHAIQRKSKPAPVAAPIETKARLVVVDESALRDVACPKCSHAFKVMLS
jgi:hypothetical protein